MNPSDAIRQQADAAEQRGLAFFNKLSKSAALSLPASNRDEELSFNVESSPSMSSPSPQYSSGASSNSRQRFQTRFGSPPTSNPRQATSHMSSDRKVSYSSLSPFGGQSRNIPNDITVSFSFFIPQTKIPALSMTLHPNLTVSQVKAMVCNKVSTLKVMLPFNLVIELDGRELPDSSSVMTVPVTNGAHLKVFMRSHVQPEEDREDSFLGDNQFDSFAQTPQTPQDKWSRGGGGGKTLLSEAPSSIKQSPYSVSSPSSPRGADLSGFSFRTTGFPDHMRNLQRPSPGGEQSPRQRQSRAYMSTDRLTSTQKTTPGGSVMSEEAAFYEVLEGAMEERGGRCQAVQLQSVEDQSGLAEAYAREVAARYEATVSQLSVHSEARAHQHLLRDLEDLRAERDLWSLASRLLVQKLLKDVKDGPNERALQSFLDSMPPSVSLQEVVDRSLLEDERVKKGRVLRDWLEGCSRDNIHEPSQPPLEEDGSGDLVFPWQETLQRLKRGSQQLKGSSSSPTGVTCVHPDAQIEPTGQLIPLDGDDHTDQETLLKAIWQHIRGGQVVAAQELAHRHNVHWLTAALMGVAEEFYSYDAACEEDEDEDESGADRGQAVSRRGNKNRPLWMQVCWKYATALNGNALNKTVAPGRLAVGVGARSTSSSQAAALEVSIYAALSTNYSTLKESVLLQSYADHLWAKVRCAHERQIAQVSSQFRAKRREFSSLYPGSSDKVVAAEHKYLRDSAALQASFSGNCAELLKDMIVHNKSSPSSISGHVLQLQAALIQGTSAISAFIQNDIRTFSLQVKAKCAKTKTADHSDVSAEHCRLMRIYVHFMIWLRYSCEEESELRGLVPDEALHLALEAYIALLVQRQQYSLLALYCSYLSRPKRLGTYTALLRVISPSSVRSQEGHIVPASTLHMGGSASLAATLSFSGARATCSHTCMSLSGRNTGQRGVDDDASALEVLVLAKRFFSEEDLVEITNAVVDLARRGAGGEGATSLGASVRHLAASFRQTGGEVMSATSSSSAKAGMGRTTFSVHTHAPTSVVPGVYDEGTIPVEDAERMEALRWLCYSEDQRADAAKEANAFLRAFMIESSGAKTLQVRVLLTSILPGDFITSGAESLQPRLDREEDPAVWETLKDSWNADVGQLELWKHADWSVSCFEKFDKLVRDFYAKQADCVGDSRQVAASLSGLKHPLLRSAEKCLQSIRTALVCGGHGGEADPQGGEEDGNHPDLASRGGLRGGFLSTWCCSIESTLASLHLLLAGHLAGVEAGAGAGGGMENGSKQLLQDGDVAAQLIRECSSAVALLEKDSAVADLGAGSQWASLFSAPATLPLVKAQLEQLWGQAAVGMSFDASCVLEKARDMLQSVKSNRQAMQLLANLLLRNYIDVCGRAASVLEQLRSPPREVLQWQELAAGVAVLLADEAAHMQLHKALAVGDLRRLLAGVGLAHTHILRLQKSFDCCK